MRLWTQVTLTILMLYKVCSNPNAQANTEGSTEPSISIGAYEFVSNVPEEFRRHFVLTEGGRKVLFQPGESRCSRVVKWLEETCELFSFHTALNFAVYKPEIYSF